MKVAATALLLGAASAATFQQSAQKVFSNGKAKANELFSQSTNTGKALWDELQLSLPGSFDQSSWFAKPKPHHRNPKSTWDYVVDGAAVQSLWTRDTGGQNRRLVDGRLEDYNLRGKKVDPSKLGVDNKVKQYSGYLDDEANDKHLFYCQCSQHFPLQRW
jgi:cathepsin A (carboxypeptidase C)